MSAAPNEVAEATSTALTVPQRAAVALSSAQRERRLAELAQASKSITAITNGDSYKQCHAARMSLKTVRIEIERTGKAAREDATAFSKAVIAEERRLIALIEPEEARLKAIQDAHDAEVERQKQARIEAERARISGIQSRIAEIAATPLRLAGQRASVIALELDDLRALHPDPELYAEFADQAKATIAATVAQVEKLHAERVEFEAAQVMLRAEAERLRLEREEQERLAAIERQRQAEAKAQAEAEAQAERERIAAERKRQEAEERERREAAAREEQARRDRIAAEERERQARIAAEDAERRARQEREDAERQAEAEKLAAQRREVEQERLYLGAAGRIDALLSQGLAATSSSEADTSIAELDAVRAAYYDGADLWGATAKQYGESRLALLAMRRHDALAAMEAHSLRLMEIEEKASTHADAAVSAEPSPAPISDELLAVPHDEPIRPTNEQLAASIAEDFETDEATAHEWLMQYAQHESAASR